MFYKTFTLSLFSLLLTSALTGQGLVDGFFNGKGQASITGTFAGGGYDEFYVADEKVGPVPAHNEISQRIYSLYGTYGLTDKLSLIASLPIITNLSDGGPDPINGETDFTGFQDAGIAVKYNLFRASFSGGRFDGIGSVGVFLPGGYEPNGIISLGSGAFTTDFKAGGHLQLQSGLFSTVIVGYSLRGKADNNFGTGDGQEFDVPNAVVGVAKIGYAGSGFYVEGFADFQSSTGGVDIMGEGFAGNFPETQVNFVRLGASASLSLSKAFSINFGYGSVVSGRNIGSASNLHAGLTASFGGGE